jgi:hypothetical protein
MVNFQFSTMLTNSIDRAFLWEKENMIWKTDLLAMVVE